MAQSRLAPYLLAPCVTLLAYLAVPWQLAEAETPGAQSSAATGENAPRLGAVAPSPPPSSHAAAVVTAAGAGARTELGPMSYDPASKRMVASLGPRRASLSISPRLQQGLEKLLADGRVPVGAAVLMEPRTGRVLALAERSERDPASHPALKAVAPAASIFKIVTSAALLEKGIAPDSEVCFHGGKHRIQQALLSDDPRRDRRCMTLSLALGKSANVVFAKLAGRELTARALQAEASRFLFDAAIPFPWPVEPSTARISSDRFQLATTAAGFGPVRMSPLHAAMLASIVANGGRAALPRVVDEVDGVPVPPSGPPQQVIRPELAAALTRMMQTTVTEGTARKVFVRDRWDKRSPLRQISVAGKTGSLTEPSPFRDYSWFVGFAPAEDPQIAVAALVVNDRVWHVRASTVAHAALRAYFSDDAVRRGVRTAAR